MGFANSPANDTIDFLFGVRWFDNWYGNYDEKKYKSYQFFHSIWPVSAYIDNNINDAKANLYLKRYNYDYTSIKDPSALYNSDNGSRTLGAINWVGRNIGRLYR